MLAGCATPGETHADYRLQGSVQNMINANELARGYIFGGRVVDTKAVSSDDKNTVEEWVVQRGFLRGPDLFGILPSHTVTYTVTFTPDPEGGTHIHMELPEEDLK